MWADSLDFKFSYLPHALDAGFFGRIWLKEWKCYPKSTDLSMLPGAVECLQLLLDARAELDLKDLTAQGVFLEPRTMHFPLKVGAWRELKSINISKNQWGYELVVVECCFREVEGVSMSQSAHWCTLSIRKHQIRRFIESIVFGISFQKRYSPPRNECSICIYNYLDVVVGVDWNFKGKKFGTGVSLNISHQRFRSNTHNATEYHQVFHQTLFWGFFGFHLWVPGNTWCTFQRPVGCQRLVCSTACLPQQLPTTGWEASGGWLIKEEGSTVVAKLGDSSMVVFQQRSMEPNYDPKIRREVMFVLNL